MCSSSFVLWGVSCSSFVFKIHLLSACRSVTFFGFSLGKLDNLACADSHHTIFSQTPEQYVHLPLFYGAFHAHLLFSIHLLSACRSVTFFGFSLGKLDNLACAASHHSIFSQPPEQYVHLPLFYGAFHAHLLFSIHLLSACRSVTFFGF